MIKSKKRIAIVGGGFSGVGAVAALKEEGHEPICFEATDKFGGTWCYREESIVGYASVMPTTVSNNSKEFGAASNFPPRKEFSTFMRHNEFLQYGIEYCKHNDCERYMRFNSEVILVKKADDYEETGQFLVTVKDKTTGKVSTEMFDGVVLATGHFAYPNMPIFPGQEKFTGTIQHSHSLKHVDKFAGKNVLIIGNGCSGLDCAEAMSSVAKKVYLSCRSGCFVLGRQGPNGYPTDYIIARRYLLAFLRLLPIWFCSWYFETFYLDSKFDHRLFYKKPKSHWLCKDPILNDAIWSKLLSGTVVQKGAVQYFSEDGCVFDGEDTITEIDVVIMATGYDFKFPYLDEGLLQIEDGKINLYKCMYPTHLPHDTLVFMGFVNPLGPGVPIGELQCRLAARIFSGKLKLPKENEMKKEVDKRHRRNVKRYTPSSIQSNRVDFLEYMDDLASLIGCKPNLLKYLFTDFPLFIRLVFGPCLSYQYRLEGPHQWDGARNAIMTSFDRVLYPLVKNKKPKKGILEMIVEFVVNLVPSNIFGL